MAEIRKGLPVLTFAGQIDFENWLSHQIGLSKGAWIRFRKKGSAVPSVTKSEAIDSAICYGWIDGQLDRYDTDSWLIRFTPRSPRSKWSKVNRERALNLISAGRMEAPGQLEVDKAKADGRWEAAYAPASSAQVPADLQTALDENPAAKAFFSTLKGANRYAILYRISVANRHETRSRKIAEFVSLLNHQKIILPTPGGVAAGRLNAEGGHDAQKSKRRAKMDNPTSTRRKN